MNEKKGMFAKENKKCCTCFRVNLKKKKNKKNVKSKNKTMDTHKTCMCVYKFKFEFCFFYRKSKILRDTNKKYGKKIKILKLNSRP